MADIKHTSGPWEMCNRGDYSDFDGRSRVILGDDKRLCVVHDPGDAESEANARLIAAAPELLEALQELADDIAGRFDMESPSTNPGMKAAVASAHAAIAKATGGGNG